MSFVRYIQRFVFCKIKNWISFCFLLLKACKATRPNIPFVFVPFGEVVNRSNSEPALIPPVSSYVQLLVSKSDTPDSK